MKDNLLSLKPVQKFIKGVGEDVRKYFGKDKGCLICLGDDGVFYGKGLYEWLRKRGAKLNLAFMENDGEGLEEKIVQERKVLIVDNDIVTGKSYKRAMEAIRAKKEKLKIKDVKFAVLCDRTGLADFSVEGYLAFAPFDLKELDGLSLRIIQFLIKDGRKSFVEIAQKTGLTSVGIKKRVEKLTEEGILKIQATLVMEKFYNVSAQIEVEADEKTISHLIEKFEKSPLVYQLVKTSGRYNLIIGIVAPSLESIETFIAKEIRSDPGVRHIEVNVGELPIIPKTWNPPVV
jgi:DNA-binding Lrp family transcriptional regulator